MLFLMTSAPLLCDATLEVPGRLLLAVGATSRRQSLHLRGSAVMDKVTVTTTIPAPPPIPEPLGFGDLRAGGLPALPTPTPPPPPPGPDPPIPPVPVPGMDEVGMDKLPDMTMPAGVVNKKYTLDY